MQNNFDEDFYIFCTPKDDKNSNSHIKILEGIFSGMVFTVDWIKLRKKYFGIFGSYTLKYHYSIIESPDNDSVSLQTLPNLIGEIIEDIWEKYYK